MLLIMKIENREAKYKYISMVYAWKLCYKGVNLKAIKQLYYIYIKDTLQW